MIEIEEGESGKAEVVMMPDGSRLVKVQILLHPEESLDPNDHPGTSTEHDVCYFKAALALFQLSEHALPFVVTLDNVG